MHPKLMYASGCVSEAALFPGAGMRRSASTRCLKGMLSPVGSEYFIYEYVYGNGNFYFECCFCMIM